MAAIAALGLAASASAQHSLPMTGTWYQNRGPLVDIPVNGGPGLCFTPPPGNVAAGCINNFRPNGGGIPNIAGQSLMITAGATANDPARFTVPTQAFGQMLGTQNAHVSIVPTVVQLDSSFLLDGPGLELGGANVDRIFEKNAWSVQGHTGRLALSFAWCPGVGGPACPDPRPTINGNPGPENGLVRYSNPGGNGFGGTMAMLTNTGAQSQVWVVVGTAGGGTPLLAIQPFGGMGTQHPGRGYATTDTDALNSGPIYIGFMTSNQTPLQTGLVGPMNGLITAIGPMIPTPNPADTNRNWGFPWTTGNVFAQNIQTNQGAMGTTTISGAGSDMRTQAGAGTITLVAGGTTHRVGAVTDFAAFDIVTMTVPEPGAALALGLSLAVIGGLYRVRRRF
jgi:hypothetical protein